MPILRLNVVYKHTCRVAAVICDIYVLLINIYSEFEKIDIYHWSG